MILSLAALFGCSAKKESTSDQQVEQKKTSKNNGQGTPERVAQKDWNEADHRLPNEQHKQQIQNLSQQFPAVVIYKGSSSLKRVALTFDDGPDNYYTPKILDILKAKGVKATFFMVGKEAKRFPDIVKRIADEGNALGNHSWDHPKLWTLNNQQITQEIVSTQNEIQQITGQRTTLFRPPYGRVTPADITLIHNLGYRVIDWSVDTLDWKGTSAPNILQIVNKEVSPGGIILEHSLASHPGELNGTVQALPQIIDHLRAQGYEFVTVPELLGESA
ncbi:polysaccharide deacetylase family protein [Bacillus sp. BRMEA1]|nr:polysaccharide deacetylase family protein [Neobacillus endophyticus]